MVLTDVWPFRRDAEGVGLLFIFSLLQVALIIIITCSFTLEVQPQAGPLVPRVSDLQVCTDQMLLGFHPLFFPFTILKLLEL